MILGIWHVLKKYWLQICHDASPQPNYWKGSPRITFNKPNNFKEIEEMITTVDKNQDGKINYSEFRVTACMHISHKHFQLHSVKKNM